MIIPLPFHVKQGQPPGAAGEMKGERLSPQGLREIVSLTDEHVARLAAHVRLLVQWQERMNLVGRSSLNDVWRRHVLDSAQLVALLPAAPQTIVDLGSGAGFPGMVLAVLSPHAIHLVESNGKKCSFLRELNRVLAARAVIHQRRIEEIRGVEVDYVIARACAPLPKLLEYARPLLKPGGKCLFLKGQKMQEELTESLKRWKMSVEMIRSLSDPAGTILHLGEIAQRHD